MHFILFILLVLPVCLQGQPLKPAAWYLQHPKVSKKAKALYRLKTVSLQQAEAYFTVLDSLQTGNNATRPFYFSLLPKLVRHADGYVAEVIGMKLFGVLEKRPQYLFSFFTANPAYKKHIQKLARHAAFGMQLWCPKQILDNGEPADREACYEKLEKMIREKCAGTALPDSDAYKEFMQAFKNSLAW